MLKNPIVKLSLIYEQEAQGFNDRITGLVKENENLKREAIARKMVTNTFNGMKGLVNNLKNKQLSEE